MSTVLTHRGYMRYLRSAHINGDAGVVKRMLENFGEVRFHCVSDLRVNTTWMELTVLTVLPNIYRAFGATAEKNPLFVLVPTEEILAVWPHDDSDEVRYGTASNDNSKLTSAVAIHKGTMGLYFCLTHITQVPTAGNLGI